eukprot:2237110-Amphidinium_carterae.1
MWLDDSGHKRLTLAMLSTLVNLTASPHARDVLTANSDGRTTENGEKTEQTLGYAIGSGDIVSCGVKLVEAAGGIRK